MPTIGPRYPLSLDRYISEESQIQLSVQEDPMNRFWLMAVALLAGCSASDGGTSAPTRPSLAIVSGANQTDTVGKTLPVQIGAKLTDANSGAPLSGRILNWSVVTGGGALFVAVTQTGSDGIGRNSWTLGLSVGQQTVVARYIDPDTGTPITTDTARATALYAAAALIWANNEAPSPHPAGIAWSSPPISRGQTFTLYYGFIDQYGNVGAAACGPVDWHFTGNPADDTIATVGAPVLLPSNAFSQDFVITGPGTSAMSFEVTSCVPGTTGYIWAQPIIPVNYQP